MDIKVKYRGKEQIISFDKDNITALDILNKLNLSSEFAFVAVNGEIVPDDYTIKNNDEVKVVNAISGG